MCNQCHSGKAAVIELLLSHETFLPRDEEEIDTTSKITETLASHKESISNLIHLSAPIYFNTRKRALTELQDLQDYLNKLLEIYVGGRISKLNSVIRSTRNPEAARELRDTAEILKDFQNHKKRSNIFFRGSIKHEHKLWQDAAKLLCNLAVNSSVLDRKDSLKVFLSHIIDQ